MIKEINPSFIVSFNYKHIIPESVIEYMGDRIINLHTSYLPYNRGSSPNFFSFYDNTKKGVTIHRVAKGLDTGDILCQKEFEFDESVETFSSSYEYLLNAIVELFKEKWMVIKSGELKAVPQSGVSTYHTMKELQEIKKAISFEWDDTIADFRCKKDSWI
ncbi:MAG: formyltransferase family protein [Lachnospiraceae bacterium]